MKRKNVAKETNLDVWEDSEVANEARKRHDQAALSGILPEARFSRRSRPAVVTKLINDTPTLGSGPARVETGLCSSVQTRAVCIRSGRR